MEFYHLHWKPGVLSVYRGVADKIVVCYCSAPAEHKGAFAGTYINHSIKTAKDESKKEYQDLMD